jgi:hypothetical protein
MAALAAIKECGWWREGVSCLQWYIAATKWSESGGGHGTEKQQGSNYKISLCRARLSGARHSTHKHERQVGMARELERGEHTGTMGKVVGTNRLVAVEERKCGRG